MKIYEKYTTYPALWNASIPSHWNVLPMYAVAREKSICNCVDLPLLSIYLDVGVIPFSDKAEKRTNVTSKDLSKYQRVDYGDFVLNNQQAWRGSVGVSFYTGIVSPAYIVLSMNNLLDSKYANYLLRTHVMVDQYLINSKSVGSIQRNIYWPALKRVKIPVPPRSEQDQIVKYLDWKVSCINKLISNYRNQIEDLEEIKLNRIDEVVIHGMQDKTLIHSEGIQWDIDYPKHWKLQRIKESFNFRKGLTITKENLEDTGVAVINYGQVHSKSNFGVGLNETLIKYVNHSYLNSSPSCIVEKGDFIFADTSEDITGCGNCAYIDWDEKIFAGYHTIIAHPNSFDNSNYLAYLFLSPSWRYQIRRIVNGVKVFSITQKMLKNVYILIPPVKEQNEIVRYLDDLCSKINIVITNVKEKISNLEELKNNLIADVVIGKIDVRNIEIPEYEFVEDETDDIVAVSENEEETE